MCTHVEFRSAKFPAYSEEEEKVNPGLWGSGSPNICAGD